MKKIILPLAIMLLATPLSAKACQIDRSIYRDTDGHGFELVFGPPIPGTGSSHATATIRHPKQGQLYNFSVTQSNGYGSIFLLSINATSNGLEYDDSFTITFFDQNSRSATPGVLGREIQAPEYAFVSSLGSFDYYRRRADVSEETAPFLGDIMWIHDRCQ